MSFLKTIIHRRVPQILGLYLGGSWALVQYIDWLVNRYGWSPYMADIAQVILVSLIPTVILVAYFHGAPDRQQWGRMEKIGIPLNLVFTFALVLFVFSGKSLDAASQTVTIEDENGQTFQRSIPTENARRQLALFAFDNHSGDKALDWLQHGLSFALFNDLSQNMFLDLWSSEWLQKRVENAGFPEGTGLPLALKQKIAREIHLDFIISGNISRTGDNLQIKAEMYQTESGRKVAEQVFRGPDPLVICDSISVFILENADLPDRTRINAVDLPVSEILTAHPNALQNYLQGRFASNFENDLQKAEQYFEKAVADDPTFTAALWDLSGVLINKRREAEGIVVLEKAMKHHYKLPERNRFYFKSFYYFFKQEIEKQFALLKMWAELYPQDVNAHLQYGNILYRRNRFDEAIEQWQTVANLDPEKQYILHNIGIAQFKKGDFDAALASYRKYADTYPDEYRSFFKLGDLYEDLGRQEEAKAQYEKALLLEPGDIPTTISLARLNYIDGNFTEAAAQHQTALASAATTADSVSVYSSLVRMHAHMGQMRKSLEMNAQRVALVKRITNPLSFIIEHQILGIEPYVDARAFDEALAILADARKNLPESLKKITAFGELQVYIAQRDTARAEAALQEVIAGIELYQREDLRHFTRYARGIIEESKGNLNAALEAFRSRIELEPWRNIHVPTNFDIARCYRKMERFAEADALMRKLIRLAPMSPELNLEMGHLSIARNKPNDAIVHLERALKIWSDADADFPEAIEASETLKRLRQAM